MRICKRLFALLLALALCAAFSMPLASAQLIGGGVTIVGTDNEQPYYFTGLCALGNQLYAIDYSNLYELDPEVPGSVKASYALPLEDMTYAAEGDEYQIADSPLAIASDGKDLYMFFQSRQLRRCAIDNGVVLFSDPIGMVEGSDGSWFNMGGMVVQDGAVYLLFSSSDGSWAHYDLWEIQLPDGATRLVASGGLTSMCAYLPGTLLIRYWDQEEAYSGPEVTMPTLCSLDIATGEMTELLSLSDTEQGCLAYDPETDTIYTATDDSLYRRVALGEQEACAYLNLQYLNSSSPSVLLNGKYYIIDNNSGTFLCSDTDPANKPERALRIAQSYKDDIMVSFMQAHPEIPVVTTETSAYNAETIAQSMISGDASADIYVTSIEWGGFEQLRDKGYCVDLSNSTILMEQVARMNPTFTAAFFQDGHLWAFPSRAYANGFGYSPGVMEKIGMTEDELPTTLIEFMDFAVDWLNDYAYDYADLTLLENVYDIRSQLFSQVVNSYTAYYAATGQTLDFDTPLMRKLLAKLDEVSPRLTEMNPEDTSSGIITYSSSDDLPSSLMTEYLYYTPEENIFSWDYQPLLLALDEGMTPAIPMSMEVYLINPNSQNVDLAVTFLEYAAQNMLASLEITLCPDANEPVEDPSILRNMEEAQKQIDSLKAQMETADEDQQRELQDTLIWAQEWLNSMEKNKYMISAENIATYREIEPYLYISTSSIYANITTDGSQLLQRYMDGQLSSEQFIKDFNRIIRMMQMEDM